MRIKQYIVYTTYMRLLFLLLFFITGCTTTVSNLPNQRRNSVLKQYACVDDVIKHYFRDGAYQAIKDIPVIYGNTFNPFVSGVNIWSDLGSIFLGNGWGRQVIVQDDDLYGTWGLRILLHEYMHHIDDMDRDGLLDLIDHNEFIVAFYLMKHDPEYKNKAACVEKKADRFITNVFGIGPDSEKIAYTATMLVIDGGPDYMWYVFRRILNRNAISESNCKSDK